MVAVARWWAVFVGALLIGAGLVIRGETACIEHLRGEVEGTFFLWRAIGQVTMGFQDQVTQTALWAYEIPERALQESNRTAWTFLVIGTTVTASSFFLKPRRKRRRRLAALVTSSRRRRR